MDDVAQRRNRFRLSFEHGQDVGHRCESNGAPGEISYMYLDRKPVYVFGHGLSYTTFDYTNFGISLAQIASDSSVEVHVDVRNSGSRAGDEVVQLYVHDNDSSEKLPAEQLQGFQRISLNPGEKKTVSFSLPVEQLAFWNTDKHEFVVNPATFNVMVGSSSSDIRAKGSFQLTTAGQWPPTELTTRAAIGDYTAAQR